MMLYYTNVSLLTIHSYSLPYCVVQQKVDHLIICIFSVQ